MQVKTNRTKREPEHRLTIKNKEIQDFVIPRFTHFTGGKKFKVVKWHNHDGLELQFKDFGNDVVKVAFIERGYGYSEDWYGKEELHG